MKKQHKYIISASAILTVGATAVALGLTLSKSSSDGPKFDNRINDLLEKGKVLSLSAKENNKTEVSYHSSDKNNDSTEKKFLIDAEPYTSKTMFEDAEKTGEFSEWVGGAQLFSLNQVASMLQGVAQKYGWTDEDHAKAVSSADKVQGVLLPDFSNLLVDPSFATANDKVKNQLQNSATIAKMNLNNKTSFAFETLSEKNKHEIISQPIVIDYLDIDQMEQSFTPEVLSDLLNSLSSQNINNIDKLIVSVDPSLNQLTIYPAEAVAGILNQIKPGTNANFARDNWRSGAGNQTTSTKFQSFSSFNIDSGPITQERTYNYVNVSEKETVFGVASPEYKEYKNLTFDGYTANQDVNFPGTYDFDLILGNALDNQAFTSELQQNSQEFKFDSAKARWATSSKAWNSDTTDVSTFGKSHFQPHEYDHLIKSIKVANASQKFQVIDNALFQSDYAPYIKTLILSFAQLLVQDEPLLKMAEDMGLNPELFSWVKQFLKSNSYDEKEKTLDIDEEKLNHIINELNNGSLNLLAVKAFAKGFSSEMFSDDDVSFDMGDIFSTTTRPWDSVTSIHGVLSIIQKKDGADVMDLVNWAYSAYIKDLDLAKPHQAPHNQMTMYNIPPNAIVTGAGRKNYIPGFSSSEILARGLDKTLEINNIYKIDQDMIDIDNADFDITDEISVAGQPNLAKPSSFKLGAITSLLLDLNIDQSKISSLNHPNVKYDFKVMATDDLFGTVKMKVIMTKGSHTRERIFTFTNFTKDIFAPELQTIIDDSQLDNSKNLLVDLLKQVGYPKLAGNAVMSKLPGAETLDNMTIYKFFATQVPSVLTSENLEDLVSRYLLGKIYGISAEATHEFMLSTAADALMWKTDSHSDMIVDNFKKQTKNLVSLVNITSWADLSSALEKAAADFETTGFDFKELQGVLNARISPWIMQTSKPAWVSKDLFDNAHILDKFK